MLVSGGKILAIDKVNTGNTILGDGVQEPLVVNTDLIATTSSVSSVSSVLEQQIDSVSSNFQNYYKKTETSGADEISAAFENFKTNQTIVSAGSPNVTVDAIPSGDKTLIYRVKVAEGNVSIVGTSGISATLTQEGVWELGLSANYLSANALEDYYKKQEVNDKFTETSAWANDTFQMKGNYVSASDFDQFKTDVNAALDKKQDVSAMTAYAQSAWVDDNYQKKGNYVSADDFNEYKTQVSQEFANTSSWANGKFQEKGDYVSATEFDDYKTEVSQEFTNTSSWANGKFQEKGEYVSASDFNEYKEQVKDEFESTSAWANETFQEKGEYVSASDFEDYKEKVEQDFENTSAWANETFQPIGEYISASEKFLSANALDDISGKWESVYDTVYTASGSWNEASAFAANSAKFVTSAGVDFNPDLAYFLKKQENDSVVWEGVDLSDLGKMYNISSLTPDLISAGISADEQNNTFYVLSAAKPGEVSVPGISGYGLSAWKDTENDEYKVSAHIVGNHGVSAAYDNETNTWQLGISANDYAFLFGGFINDTTVTDGTILKLESNNKHLIDIDEDGYITLPETTNKFTFCINEYVDDNTTENHEYLLNKLVLSAKNNDPIVTSQSYYPSEVGSSNVTLAITVDNTAAADREFCIVYKGSDVGTHKLHINASILEEVTSLDSTAGSVDDYTGINPIYVVDNDRQIGLGWDESVFKLTEADELGRRKLTIDAGSETVDAQKFEKMAELIDSRMTETFPIGLVCDEGVIHANSCVSYMFRPSMTYDCTSATSAYIYNGTVDDNQVYARIGIYEIRETDTELVWKSALTLIKKNSQNTFSADGNTVTGTISTDKLYYACILTNNKQIGDILGINGNGTADVGLPQPWCTVDNINTQGKPFNNTDFSQSVAFADFGSFTGTIKPYIGLRGSIQ